MRIVAGKFRGRNLATPNNSEIRPTTDRVRESLFAILESRYAQHLDGSRILDMFAGTGALGLEAMSRGADFALFADNSTQACSLVRRNIDSLGLERQTKIMRIDATRIGSVGKMKPFDLVFADPPYEKGLADKSLSRLIAGGWLNPDALIIIEDKAGSPAPSLSACTVLDERKFGETKIWFMKPHG
ncbi:MAG: 16S rRNA (guanine(966)-N(2))-methyltransferase RsmD [Hyphomicrobiales bacterium]|nr:16S rRNA (guanine(966)-N(2))-methyltransferase RsmD [Hyphomicrobiales bacterium]